MATPYLLLILHSTPHLSIRKPTPSILVQLLPIIIPLILPSRITTIPLNPCRPPIMTLHIPHNRRTLLNLSLLGANTLFSNTLYPHIVQSSPFLSLAPPPSVSINYFFFFFSLISSFFTALCATSSLSCNLLLLDLNETSVAFHYDLLLLLLLILLPCCRLRIL